MQSLAIYFSTNSGWVRLKPIFLLIYKICPTKPLCHTTKHNPHPPSNASSTLQRGCWVDWVCFLSMLFGLGRGARFIQVMCKTSILASVVKFMKCQSMDVENLKKQVQLMRVLVAGCKKHPAYRAIRPTTGKCEPCVKMWKARLELNSTKKQTKPLKT